MEVERAQTRVIGLILGLRKTKEKIYEGKKYTGLRPRFIKRGLSPTQKNAAILVKNGA